MAARPRRTNASAQRGPRPEQGGCSRTAATPLRRAHRHDLGAAGDRALGKRAGLDRDLVRGQLRMLGVSFALGAPAPVLRSTTTRRPCSSRSSRSTRPEQRVTGRSSCASSDRNSRSTSMSRRGLLPEPAEQLVHHRFGPVALALAEPRGRQLDLVERVGHVLAKLHRVVPPVAA